MKHQIVALYAATPRSGKSSAADALIHHHGYVRAQFSEPIKRMFRAFAMECGLDDTTIQRCLEGDLKQIPVPALGNISFRTYARTIGTTWGRDTIRESFWVDLWQQKWLPKIEAGQLLVVDDLRRENEYWALTNLRARVTRVYVARPNHDGGPDFSDALTVDWFDHVLVNDGTLADLHQKILDIVR